MSIVEFLLDSRTPLELAKELAATAKENAVLRDKTFALEVELFWMKAAERQEATMSKLKPPSDGVHSGPGAHCAGCPPPAKVLTADELANRTRQVTITGQASLRTLTERLESDGVVDWREP